MWTERYYPKQIETSANVHDLDDRNNLINFLRTGCQFFGSWPAKSNSSKCTLLFLKIMYYVHLSNELYSAIGIFNGLRCCYTGLTEFIKSFIEVTFMFEVLFNIIYYGWKTSEFQVLIAKMELFFETSDPRERMVKKDCLKRTKFVYYVLLAVFAAGGTFFGLSPLFTAGRLTPVNTVYPMIPLNRHWGRYVTYVFNILHIVNAASVVFLDMLIMSIIWHAACKFSLLGETLRHMDGKELKKWIRKHQAAISYANEVNHVIAPLAVKSTIAVTLYVIVSCLVIIHAHIKIEDKHFSYWPNGDPSCLLQRPKCHLFSSQLYSPIYCFVSAKNLKRECKRQSREYRVATRNGLVDAYLVQPPGPSGKSLSYSFFQDIPFFELSKFFIVTILSILRYLSCSWSADVLTEKARDVALDICDFSITNGSTKIRKEAILIVQRCQKPVAIRTSGFLTAWSLNFCGRVLYSIFTYFTTLRAALHV